MDLSYFDRPITAAPGRIRFGYAAITWNGNDAQAIKEISELGFPGIQLRSNILKDFGEQPKALRDLLDQHHLEMVALSSGGVSIAPGFDNDEIAKHVRNAKFVHDVGGNYLQVTDSARPKGRKPEAADFKELGRVLTEIGKRAVDLGVPEECCDDRVDVAHCPRCLLGSAQSLHHFVDMAGLHVVVTSEPARAPDGDTKITTGSGAPSIFLMMSRIEVSRPPGVSMAMISAVSCACTALSTAVEM